MNEFMTPFFNMSSFFQPHMHFPGFEKAGNFDIPQSNSGFRNASRPQDDTSRGQKWQQGGQSSNHNYYFSHSDSQNYDIKDI